MLLRRLVLIFICGLALAGPSLADGNPSSAGAVPAPLPQATWSALGAGPVISDTVPWKANRIYYARTPDQFGRWLPYLRANDRPAIRRTNFSKYGILVVFYRGSVGQLAMRSLYLVTGGLNAQVLVSPWCHGLPPYAPCPAPPGNWWGNYVIAKVRKASLPAPVRLLYISEVVEAP